MRPIRAIAFLWLALFSPLLAEYIQVERVTNIKETKKYEYGAYTQNLVVSYEWGNLHDDGSFERAGEDTYSWYDYDVYGYDNIDQTDFDAMREYGQWAKGSYVKAYTKPTSPNFTVEDSHPGPYGNNTYYKVSVGGKSGGSGEDEEEIPVLSEEEALEIIEFLGSEGAYEAFIALVSSDSFTKGAIKGAFIIAAEQTDDPFLRERIQKLGELMAEIHDFASAGFEGGSPLEAAQEIHGKVGAYKEIVNGMAGWMTSIIDHAFAEALVNLSQPVSSALGGASYVARGSYYGNGYTPYNTDYGYSTSFGNTADSLFPYTYLLDYNAWVYVDESARAIFIYSPVTGTFVPTSGNLFPYGFSITHGKWAYFYPNSPVNAIALYDPYYGGWIYSDTTVAPYGWHYGLNQWIRL